MTVQGVLVLTVLAFLFCFSWGMLILGGVLTWRYELRHERPVLVAAVFSFVGAWLTLAGGWLFLLPYLLIRRRGVITTGRAVVPFQVAAVLGSHNRIGPAITSHGRNPADERAKTPARP